MFVIFPLISLQVECHLRCTVEANPIPVFKPWVHPVTLQWGQKSHPPCLGKLWTYVISKTTPSLLIIIFHYSQSTVIDLGGLTSSWPSSVSSPLTYRMGNSKISFQKPFVLGFLVFSAIFLLFYFTYSGYSLRSSSKDTSQFYESLHKNNFDRFNQIEPKTHLSAYNTTYPLTSPTRTPKGLLFKIAAIADPDVDSKVIIFSERSIYVRKVLNGYSI